MVLLGIAQQLVLRVMLASRVLVRHELNLRLRRWRRGGRADRRLGVLHRHPKREGALFGRDILQSLWHSAFPLQPGRLNPAIREKAPRWDLTLRLEVPATASKMR